MRARRGIWEMCKGRVLGVGAVSAIGLVALILPAMSGASVAHFYDRSFGPDGTSGSTFSRPGPIGIDQESHAVYVGDPETGILHKFDEGGSPDNFTALGTPQLPGVAFRGGRGENQIAVAPSGGRIYVNTNANAIVAYDRTGLPGEFSALSSSEITGFGEACGVATDQSGNIYVGDYFGGVSGTGAVRIFSPAGTELTSFPTETACSVAVDSGGDVYVNPFQSVVSKFAPSEFPVTAATTYTEVGTVDSGPAFSVAVDPVADEVYVARQLDEQHAEIVQYDDEGQMVTRLGGEGEPFELTVAESVAVDGGNGNVFVSDGESFLGGGTRQIALFVPPPLIPPTVGASAISHITTSSAMLEAKVNPNFYATQYRFQYVTQAQYEASEFADAAETVLGELGNSGAERTARAQIEGLSPGTTYRFRVAAENIANSGSPVFSTVAAKFTTFSAVSPGLPDGRAYELVSPAQKLGNVLQPERPELLGGSFCPGEECSPGKSLSSMPMQATADGSSIVYEGQPFAPRQASIINEFKGLRSSNGWSTEGLSSPVFGAASEQGFKAFDSTLSRGVLSQIEPALTATAPTRGGKSFANLYLWREGGLQPLIEAEPPEREPGSPSGSSLLGTFRVRFAGANAGAGGSDPFTHLIFGANDALTAEVPGVAPASPPIGAEETCGKGDNCNLYEWVGGELRLINVLPGNAAAVPDAVIGSGYILSDQTREGWDVDHAISDDGSRIFWSDESSGQLYVRIDGSETKQVANPGRFLTASADGSQALLDNGCLYDVDSETCQDVTKDKGGTPQGGFQGILGAAQDLSRLFFVDTAVLTGSDENANGESAVGGGFNLYSWDEGGPTFIGVLSGQDNGNPGTWTVTPQRRTAQVSPDGRYLSFMSSAKLTGYDNTYAGSGNCPKDPGPCSQVFAYDALSEILSCASCNPTGLRPGGGSNLNLLKVLGSVDAPFPQPSNLTAAGGGRVFFESRDVLSPRDVNGEIQDLYQWEPSGVGGCTRSAGCISLLSTGRSQFDVWFLDATPSGNDVFFVTREQLVPADKDGLFDLYDARVGGGFDDTEVAPCGGEGCKAPPGVAPPQSSPGSSSFVGPTNPKSKKKSKQNKKKNSKKKNSKKKGKKGNKRSGPQKRATASNKGGSK